MDDLITQAPKNVSPKTPLDFSKGKKTSHYCTCSNHPKKQTEYLILLQNDIAYIGAKRKAKTDLKNNPKRSANHKLTGKPNRLNGIDYSCLHCPNTQLIFCSCGLSRCHPNAGKSICPNCETITTETTPADYITSTVSADQNRKISNQSNFKLITP